MDSKIKNLIDRLARRTDSATVANPYRHPPLRANLGAYLEALGQRPGKRILVVAEALGYRGGLHTGIPISSARLLREAPHPFLRHLRQQLAIEQDQAEATASMVWDYLQGRRRIPLFWNAFPFHPHLPGKPASNRAPNASEMREGQVYLEMIGDLYHPVAVAGLGHKGGESARRAFPDVAVQQLRHPSYGGKSDFCRGMDRLLRH